MFCYKAIHNILVACFYSNCIFILYWVVRIKSRNTHLLKVAKFGPGANPKRKPQFLQRR